MLRNIFLTLIVFVTFVSPLHAADNSLETRLRVLEDKEQIRVLLLDYGRLLDDREWTAFSELFARNGGRTARSERRAVAINPLRN